MHSAPSAPAPLASPRGILKTAASRAERRQAQHAAQTAALLERPPLIFKVLVLGGPGVGKSAVLRAAAGRALPPEELARYAPTRTPAFATLLAATFQGRVVYLQLWEVPFALVVAEAQCSSSGGSGGSSGSSSSGDGRRYPCSGHLDVALAGAHAAVLVADAREGASPDSQPLRVPYALFGAAPGAPLQRRSWQGSSLEACDLARRVLHGRAARGGAETAARPMPLYLLMHKADHPAALAASLASVLAAAAAAAAAQQQPPRGSSSSSSGGGGSLAEDLGSGVDAAGVAASAAAAAAAAPPPPAGTHGAAPASLPWTEAALAAPLGGHGVSYLRFWGGGALAPGDLTRYAAACGLRGWGWGSALGALAHAPPPPSALAGGAAGSSGSEEGEEGEEEEGGGRGRRASLAAAAGGSGRGKGAGSEAGEGARARSTSSLAGFFLPLARQASGGGSGSSRDAGRRSASFAAAGSLAGGGGEGGGRAVVGVLEGELGRRLAGLAGGAAARSSRPQAPPPLLQPCASLKALIALITDDLLEMEMQAAGGQ